MIDVHIADKMYYEHLNLQAASPTSGCRFRLALNYTQDLTRRHRHRASAGVSSQPTQLHVDPVRGAVHCDVVWIGASPTGAESS